jgi:hypothetical protein
MITTNYSCRNRGSALPVGLPFYFLTSVDENNAPVVLSGFLASFDLSHARSAKKLHGGCWETPWFDR